MSAEVYEVPDALLMEAGLGAGSGIVIRCDVPGCVHVPLTELRGPVIAPGKRGLKLARLRRILSARMISRCSEALGTIGMMFCTAG